MATSWNSDLDLDLIRCPVCVKTFRAPDRMPKMLSCNHTFCLACLLTLYSYGKVTCPCCQRDTKLVADTGVASSGGTMGSVVTFKPVRGCDLAFMDGVSLKVPTILQCITAMTTYTNKSFEELRFEDYNTNRKGPESISALETDKAIMKLLETLCDACHEHPGKQSCCHCSKSLCSDCEPGHIKEYSKHVRIVLKELSHTLSVSKEMDSNRAVIFNDVPDVIMKWKDEATNNIDVEIQKLLDIQDRANSRYEESALSGLDAIQRDMARLDLARADGEKMVKETGKILDKPSKLSFSKLAGMLERCRKVTEGIAGLEKQVLSPRFKLEKVPSTVYLYNIVQEADDVDCEGVDPASNKELLAVYPDQKSSEPMQACSTMDASYNSPGKKVCKGKKIGSEDFCTRAAELLKTWQLSKRTAENNKTPDKEADGKLSPGGARARSDWLTLTQSRDLEVTSRQTSPEYSKPVLHSVPAVDTLSYYRGLTSPGAVIGRRGSKIKQFQYPFHVAVSPVDGRIYVTDFGNHRVQHMTENGRFPSVFGGDGLEPGKFNAPRGIGISGQGQVAVMDDHRLQLFEANGTFRQRVGRKGNGLGKFLRPYGVAYKSNSSVYVADNDNARVQLISMKDQSLVYARYNGVFPVDVAVALNGQVYVVTSGQNPFIYTYPSNHVAFPSEHRISVKFGAIKRDNGYGFSAVAVDKNGLIIVADRGSHSVLVIDSDGDVRARIGDEGSIAGHFLEPTGVALTREGRLIVCDHGNHRLQIF